MADNKDEHQRALDQFKLVCDTEAEQRARELEDLQFDAGDQWPEDVRAARSGIPAGNGRAAIPARPMITIRTLDQPTAQIINQARNARFAIKISPKSDATQKDAEVRQGLIRAIEYDSHAQTAYLWAYQRAVICGRGYFRVNKCWAYDDPDESAPGPAQWDQDLRIEPILNGASVYLDPWAQAVNDPAAAEWAFVTEDIPKSRYQRLFGKSKLANASDGEVLTTLGDYKDQWVTTGEGGEPIYRIAERFWVVYDESTTKNPADKTQERTVTTRKVLWAKMNGLEFLEGPQEWDGQYIPIIPVVGNEKNIGGKRYWEGIVRPNLGPCRMINYLVSSDAENMGLATRAPWIGFEGQFEGHETEWQQANTRNQPYLEVKPTTDATGAQILPLPQRNIPVYPPSNEAIGLYVNFVRSTTGVPDAALGHVNPNDRSGKAIAALQQASEMGTSNYPDHLQRAIQHAGKVILDLMPKIYDRPGRVEQILTGQTDEQDTVILNAPFVRGPNGPMPADQGVPLLGAQVEHYDLSKGQYSVVVDVGKSFATRRQEAMAGMGALAQSVPELVPRFADLWVKAMDIPESTEIAERLKPPGVDKQQQQIPPEIQAALSALQQENQALKMAIATKQVEQQAKIQTARHADETKLRVAGIQSETQIAVEELKQQSADVDRRIRLLESLIGLEHESRMADRAEARDDAQRQHETSSQAHAQAHEAGMAAMGHVHTSVQQATKPQPKPANGQS